MVQTWKPNKGPQAEALLREEYEILFGGRRGGGKSEGGRGWLKKVASHPLYRALVIRRNANDLADWADRAGRLYSQFGAERVGQPPEYKFPDGSVIRSGHLKDENAYMKYQGQEYQRVLIEELTQIPQERNYLMLISSCRSTIPEIPPQVFATCNPDGPGFYWVKRRWNLHGIPKKVIVTEYTDKETGKSLNRAFVPAGVSDNPYLDKDPTYRAFLNTLPDGLREAWRDGSWDDPVIEGAYYTRELLQASKEDRVGMVPFRPELRVHTVWDLGIGDSMTIGFWQKTAKDIRIINYYENEGFGIDHYLAVLEEYQREYRYNYGLMFMPHDAKERELATGKTLVQSIEALGYRNIQVVPKMGIEAGIQQVRLMFPRIYINEPLCQQYLSAIRNYRKKWDEKFLKWSDDPIHDWTSHAADMTRYTAVIEYLMTNDVGSKPKTYVYERNPATV